MVMKLNSFMIFLGLFWMCSHVKINSNKIDETEQISKLKKLEENQKNIHLVTPKKGNFQKYNQHLISDLFSVG